MKRKNLLELELSIPSIDLITTRALLGGIGYNDIAFERDLPGVDIIDTPIFPPEFDDPPHREDWEHEFDLPYYHDPIDDDRDEDRPPDIDEDRNEEQEQEQGLVPRGNNSDWEPQSGVQKPYGCAFSVLLEMLNQQNPDSKVDINAMHQKMLEFVEQNGLDFPVWQDQDGQWWPTVPIEGFSGFDFADFYEFVMGDEMPTEISDILEMLDNDQLAWGMFETDRDDQRHAVAIFDYGYKDGELWFHYWDPQDDQFHWRPGSDFIW